MIINLKQYHDNLLFIPLGGVNEIGINVNLYHYKGKWIMVDCGSGFADENFPGVDIVIADLSFIEERKKDLLGIILTHAHEDHLGAVQYLWNELDCPIYTTKFTKSFLLSKITEYTFTANLKVHEVNPLQRLTLGPFNIDMIGLTHSAPEMQALVIRTDVGNVIHTGDWKFDPMPVVGTVSDQQALKACGDEGVLALVCDSTNVLNQGISGSEGDVRASLTRIISTCPNLVVVTTFASNLARLDTIIYAGQQAGRKVALSGRSLHRMFTVAQECGYLQDINPLIDERSIGYYKRENILVIATGCQGEPTAAIAKMANATHHAVKLAKKDTIIFSSKIIPGNDKKISKLLNVFVKQGVEVITEQDHFVHVSGHPNVEDLKQMYDLVRPQVCIPIHGEPMHIHAHVKLAQSSGCIKEVITVENGSVVLLSKNYSKVIDCVKNGYLAVDGNYLLPDNSHIFKMRRKMSNAGIVVLSMVLDNKLRLTCQPMLSVPGLFDPVEDIDIINQLKHLVIQSLDNQRKHSPDNLTLENIELCVKRTLRRAIKKEVNKNTVIIINIESLA